MFDILAMGKPLMAENSPVMSDEEKARIKQMVAEQDAKKAAEEAARKAKEAPAMPVLESALSRFSVGGSYLTPEDRALRQDLATKFKQLVVDSEQNLERGEQRIKDAEGLSTGFNLTPIAALADKWSGGGNQLSQAAKATAEPSQEEKIKLLADLQQAQGDDQNQLAQIVGSRLSTLDSHRLAEMSDKNARFQTKMDRDLFLKYNSDLRNDTKTFPEILAAYGAIEANLKPDANGMISAAQLKQSLSNASRTLGEKGVLTDQDISRVQIRSIDAMLADLQMRFGDPNAKIPYEQVKPLLASIQNGKNAWTGAMQKRVDTTRRMYTMGGMSPEIADYGAKTIYGEYLTGEPTAPPAAGAPGAYDSQKDADEILKSLGF